MLAGGFYCQDCGIRVKPGSKICSVCGGLFLSVCCPRCGHEGSSETFVQGCPSCSYPKKLGRKGLSEGRRSAKRGRQAFPGLNWSVRSFWILTLLLILALGFLVVSYRN